jgi:hypothetical protein
MEGSRERPFFASREYRVATVFGFIPTSFMQTLINRVARVCQGKVVTGFPEKTNSNKGL